MHPESYEQFLAMKEEERHSLYPEKAKNHCQLTAEFEQSDFNRIVLEFMINGMHHPKLLEDRTFDTLLNGNEYIAQV